MSRLRLRLPAVAVLALAIVFGAETSQLVAESYQAAEEDRMLAMVNEHRASRGLGRLEMNDGLRWVARRHTRRMAEAGRIYHNGNLAAEAEEAVPGWRLLGENVGVGPSTDSVQSAFLNSPKHRENIETGKFNVVGIGAYTAPDGRMYFTQNFAQWTPSAPAPQPTAQPQPAPAVAPAPAAAPKVRQPAPAPVKAAAAAAPVRTEPTAPEASDGSEAQEPAPSVLSAPPAPSGDAVPSPTLIGTLLQLFAAFFERLTGWIA